MTLVQRETTSSLPGGFNREQLDLIKRTVAAGTTDDEFALFMEVCNGTGLNPFQRQVYAIKRRSGREEKMTIQTGIDGYRLIASRTGVHLGTTDAEFGPANADGYPEWARVTVRKLVQGHTVEFPATARWSEYVQTKDEWANQQRTGRKIVGDMWAKMPHTMLGKCAEALALRKAFPAELSGVYTNEEMQQADNNLPAESPSGKPPQDNHKQKALEAWVKKIGDVATRVRNVAPDHEVQVTLDLYAWREDVEAARACYADLKALGKQYTQKPAEDVVDAELTPGLITDQQRGALMAHLKRGGLSDDSSTRSAFYSWIAGTIKPGTIKPDTRTKELTEEDAAGLLDVLGSMDTDTLTQTMGEFMKERSA